VIEGREVLELDGELQEVTASPEQRRMELAQITTFEQAKEYGRMKRYNGRWAWNYWQARQRTRA
jgi:hypothetical protein